MHKKSAPLTRREALRTMGSGFGMTAFAAMIGQSVARAASMGSEAALPQPHHAPKAKNIIFLFMNGGVSQVDTFDPKPALAKYDGQPLPGGSVKTERKTGAAFPSPFKFKQYGESGIHVSERGECATDTSSPRTIRIPTAAATTKAKTASSTRKSKRQRKRSIDVSERGE